MWPSFSRNNEPIFDTKYPSKRVGLQFGLFKWQGVELPQITQYGLSRMDFPHNPKIVLATASVTPTQFIKFSILYYIAASISLYDTNLFERTIAYNRPSVVKINRCRPWTPAAGTRVQRRKV